MISKKPFRQGIKNVETSMRATLKDLPGRTEVHRCQVKGVILI